MKVIQIKAIILYQKRKITSKWLLKEVMSYERERERERKHINFIYY